ncbi:unnamed protein product, partial [marine sediment metagenome]
HIKINHHYVITSKEYQSSRFIEDVAWPILLHDIS